ncbi:MAG TPA: hypothetical protein VN704_13220 [Verrucomicrobiae bacterium]|nr:hypothetical protein [Verrucomicrobiae bacterium]
MSTKTKLVHPYKKENDLTVRKLLLILKVWADKQLPFHVVKDIRRNNPWTFDWLNYYDIIQHSKWNFVDSK